MIGHQPVDHTINVFRGDEAGALILAVSVFVAGAPREVVVDELDGPIAETAVADIVVDNPIRSVELHSWETETTDKNDWLPNRPCQPGQTAREAHKKVSMKQDVYPLLERQVASEVFRSVGDCVPAATGTMTYFLVYAQNPVAFFLKVLNSAQPTERVVPVLGLGGRLAGNANIGFSNGSLDIPWCD